MFKKAATAIIAFVLVSTLVLGIFLLDTVVQMRRLTQGMVGKRLTYEELVE